MIIIPLWAKALIVSALLSALAWGVHLYNQSIRDDQRALDVSEYNVEKLQQAEVNKKAFAALIASRDKQDADLTASNDKNQKQLKEAQNETTRLRNLANSGSVGLHINAICPNPGNDAKVTGYASVDTGTGAELNASARQAYFDLRDGINQVEAKLNACQGELKLRQ